MNYKIWIFSFLTVLYGTQWAMEKKNALTLFTEKYAPPKEIIELIEKNKEKIRKTLKRTSCWHTKDLSGIYLKGLDICRIINAQRIDNCIKKNNLHRLGVTRKYIYKLDDSWVIFAEKVNKSKIKDSITFDSEAIQQLILFVKKTGYTDWGYWDKYDGRSTNLIYDVVVNKFILIDTEDQSFTKFGRDGNALSRLIFLSGMLGRNISDKEGAKLLEDQDENEKDFNNDITLVNSTEFDDSEINFENVKIQFNEERMRSKEIKEQKIKDQQIREEQFENSAYGPGFIGLL